MFTLENINIFTHRGLDCLESCLATISNHYRGTHALAYSRAIDFNFNAEKNETIGGALNFYPRNIAMNLRKIYKIDLNAIDSLENDLADTVNLSPYPILAVASTFDCPWLNEYKIINQLRYFLVLYVEDDTVYFVDPILDKKIKTLPISSFSINTKKIFRVDLLPETAYDFDAQFRYSLNAILAYNPTEDFEAFIDRIKMCHSIDKEYTKISKNYIVSELDDRLGNKLAGSRGLYALFLQELNDHIHSNKLREIADEYNKLEKKWLVLRNLFYRSYLNHTFKEEKNKIISQTYLIVYEEVKLRNALLFYGTKYYQGEIN